MQRSLYVESTGIKNSNDAYEDSTFLQIRAYVILSGTEKMSHACAVTICKRLGIN